MNLEAGVNVGQLLLAIAVMLVTSGIAWGGLLTRVRQMEKQLEGFPGVSERLRVVETKVEDIQGDVSEIKGDVKGVLQELRTFNSDPRRRRDS